MTNRIQSEIWSFLENELRRKSFRISFLDFFQVLWEKNPDLIRSSSRVRLPSDRKLMKLLVGLENEGKIRINHRNNEILLELPETNNSKVERISREVSLIRQHPSFDNDNIQSSWHIWRELIGLPMGVPRNEILAKLEELLDIIPTEFQKERTFVDLEISHFMESQSLVEKQPFRHQIHYDGEEISMRLGTFTREDVLDLFFGFKPISLQELYDRAGAINEADKPRLRSSIKQLIDMNLIEKTSRGMYIQKVLTEIPRKKRESKKKQITYHQKIFIEILKQLHQKGLIQEKQLLIGNHKGKEIKAVLIIEEGLIELQGKYYTSLSAATRATGDKRNGWIFWNIPKTDNHLVPMNELRKSAKKLKFQ